MAGGVGFKDQAELIKLAKKDSRR